MAVAFVSNDNVVQLDALADVDGYINNATVAAVINTKAGVEVVASFTLTYVTASNGRYRGTIEEDAAITSGTEYVLVVSATASSDRKGSWSVPLKAMTRTS